jgi:tetratricopeptide (TPR) repeat protein
MSKEQQNPQTVDNLDTLPDWLSSLDSGDWIAIIVGVITLAGLIVAFLAWRMPKKSPEPTGAENNHSNNNSGNNNSGSGNTIIHDHSTKTTGVDPETHAKSLAKIMQLEQQLAEIQQATIASLSDNDEIRKLVEQGDYQQAEKLALKDESYKGTSLLLFRLSYLQGKDQEAIHRGEALLSSGYQGDAEFYFMLGTAYVLLEQYDKAISNLAEAIKLEPDVAVTHNNLGYAYAKKGEYDKAIVAFNQAIKLKPDDAADAHYALGVTYGEKGENDQAIASFNQAIKLKPDYVEAHYNLGVTYDEIENYDRAIVAFNQAIKLKPDLVQAHYNLGVTYYKKGEYDKAIVAFNQAIKLKPDYVEAHYNLGVTYDKIENYDRAIVAYNQAIKLKPDYVEAHYNLGVTYDEIENYDRAIVAFNKVLAVDPNNENAQIALELLKELKAEQQ